METEPRGKLAAALAKAQGEFTAVPKNKTARVKMKSGGEFVYKYADLADVLKMALPILAKHELAFTQPLRRIDGRLAVTTRIAHSSGEFQQSDGIAIPENLSPQEFGSCLSYWRRYDGCALLGIAPDEDDDGALATDTARASSRRASQTSQQGNDAAKGQETAATPGPAVISEAQRKRLFAICRDLSLNTDALKDFIMKQYGFASTRDITRDRYDAIVTWLQGK
jgi:hypothetical protein